MPIDDGGGSSPEGQSLCNAELAVLGHVKKQHVPMVAGLVRKWLAQGGIWRPSNDETQDGRTVGHARVPLPRCTDGLPPHETSGAGVNPNQQAQCSQGGVRLPMKQQVRATRHWRCGIASRRPTAS